MVACKICNSTNAPGMRWCSICHTNLIDPSIGRLSAPGKRFGANVLDALVPVFVVLVIAAQSSRFLAFLIFAAYVVWALMLFSRGTTPGKRLLGMYVVQEGGRRAGFGTMLFREWIGKWISGLVFGLGFLWILFDRDKQGWHDKFASTYVAEPTTAIQPPPTAVLAAS